MGVALPKANPSLEAGLFPQHVGMWRRFVTSKHKSQSGSCRRRKGEMRKGSRSRRVLQTSFCDAGSDMAARNKGIPVLGLVRAP